MAPDDWVHILVVHHIAADGWSLDLMFDEIEGAYRAAVSGQRLQLEPLPMQYRDYAQRTRATAAGTGYEHQLAFWENALAKPLPVVEFQPDFPRPAVHTDAGGKAVFTAATGSGDALNAIADRLGVTPFTVSLAAFFAFVHRHTGAADIVVGVPTAGRRRLDVESVVGYFINTAAVRLTLNAQQTLEGIVAAVRETTLAIYENLEVPFDEVVRRVNPERDSSRPPVFQLLFQHFDTDPDEGMRLPGIDVVHIDEDDYPTAKFDFEVDIYNSGGVLAGDIAYDADLYTPESAARIAASYGNFLGQVLARPDEPVGDAAMMTGDERRLILDEFAGGHVEARRALPFEFFKGQAENRPDAAALVHDGETISYGELLGRVAGITQRFRRSRATSG